MSQERLGEAIGLTFQQVQKYERGSNRISAGTLYRLGQVLDVPVSFFFDCYDDSHSQAKPPRSGASADGAAISRREARLLRLWRAAPTDIANEMLSLLAALSPDLQEVLESAEGQPAGATLAGATSGVDRSVPPEPLVVRVESRSSRRPRRRHGAVWDPADIFRAAKGDA